MCFPSWEKEKTGCWRTRREASVLVRALRVGGTGRDSTNTPGPWTAKQHLFPSRSPQYLMATLVPVCTWALLSPDFFSLLWHRFIVSNVEKASGVIRAAPSTPCLI